MMAPVTRRHGLDAPEGRVRRSIADPPCIRVTEERAHPSWALNAETRTSPLPAKASGSRVVNERPDHCVYSTTW